jgi:hypothetical protein
VTDQRQRFVFSWIYEPRALNGGQGWIGKISNGWKSSGVFTAGSGRPLNASIVGDANQDGNSDNDRLPGASRNSLLGPNYATTDMRLARKLYSRKGLKLDFTAESFNLFNRMNHRFRLTDDGAMSNAAQFNYGTMLGIGIIRRITRFQLTSCGRRVPTHHGSCSSHFASGSSEFRVKRRVETGDSA